MVFMQCLPHQRTDGVPNRLPRHRAEVALQVLLTVGNEVTSDPGRTVVAHRGLIDDHADVLRFDVRHVSLVAVKHRRIANDEKIASRPLAVDKQLYAPLFQLITNLWNDLSYRGKIVSRQLHQASPEAEPLVRLDLLDTRPRGSAPH